jgi:hypothetical protein
MCLEESVMLFLTYKRRQGVNAISTLGTTAEMWAKRWRRASLSSVTALFPRSFEALSKT